MATNLAGNLALVTCREPLRITLTTTITESIKSAVKDPNKADSTIKEIVTLNLDLGCQMVMKIIRSKTKSQIENDKEFLDYTKTRPPHALNLPDTLNDHHTRSLKIKVYESFEISEEEIRESMEEEAEPAENDPILIEKINFMQSYMDQGHDMNDNIIEMISKVGANQVVDKMSAQPTNSLYQQNVDS
jgi:hypothetical protein